MNASELLRSGFEHLSAGRHARARTDFEAARATAADAAPEMIRALRGLAAVDEAAGRPERARARLERASELGPDDAQVQRELGLLLARTGDTGAAVERLRRASELDASSVEIANDLGAALFDARRLDDAAASYRRALKLAPAAPIPALNLAEALEAAGEPDAAIEAARRAATSDPDLALSWSLLGATLVRANRPDEALGPLSRAVRLEPNDRAARDALARVRSRVRSEGARPAATRRSEAAARSDDVAAARRAATCDPDRASAWSRLGTALARAKRVSEALGPLRRAIELEPDDAGVQLALAQCLYALDADPNETASAFERAVELDANDAAAWRGLGHVELRRERYVAAARGLERALELEPDHPYARFHRAQALFELGDADESIAELRALAENGPSELRAAAAMNLAVTIPGAPTADHADVLAARRAFARTLPRTIGPGPEPRASSEPLVVGYVSSFFHRRNWMKPVWGLVNEHDRERVRVHLFSDAPLEALEGGYVQHATDRFTDLGGMSNQDAAAAIRAAAVDVLVDLNGYSEPNRLELYTRRPAPVIVGWFNLYATTGLDAFDALIGDDSVVTASEEEHFSERIVRVPGSYLTFSVDYPVPDVAPPPCLESGVLTLGCLASAYKITGDVVATWARMLAGAPNTRLLCRNKLLGTDEHRAWFAERFARAGVAPDRLELLGPCEHTEFLGTYDRVDVALDVFPYNGGTTTTEALWQGVPVATFAGDRWASRTSASLLNAGGLAEFVAPNVDEHVARVVALANDPDTPARLSELRAGLRSRLRAAPVCDTRGFARSMEALYRTLVTDRDR